MNNDKNNISRAGRLAALRIKIQQNKKAREVQTQVEEKDAAVKKENRLARIQALKQQKKTKDGGDNTSSTLLPQLWGSVQLEKSKDGGSQLRAQSLDLFGERFQICQGAFYLQNCGEVSGEITVKVVGEPGVQLAWGKEGKMFWEVLSLGVGVSLKKGEKLYLKNFGSELCHDEMNYIQICCSGDENFRFCQRGEWAQILSKSGEMPEKLQPWACFKLFNGCWGLKGIEGFQIFKGLGVGCFKNMFSFCKNLAEVGEVSWLGEQLAESCFACMFYDDDSLKAAKWSISAKVLPKRCCFMQFWQCDNLSEFGCIKYETAEVDAINYIYFKCPKAILSQVLIKQ